MYRLLGFRSVMYEYGVVARVRFCRVPSCSLVSTYGEVRSPSRGGGLAGRCKVRSSTVALVMYVRLDIAECATVRFLFERGNK